MILKSVGSRHGFDVRFAINGKERAPWCDVPYNDEDRARESTVDAMSRAYNVPRESVEILEMKPIIATPLSHRDECEYLFRVKDVLVCAVCGISVLDSFCVAAFTRIHDGCHLGNTRHVAERRKKFMT